MMSTKKSDTLRRRIKLIIKTFLLCNPDKKVTARELSDWINNNHLGLQGHSVSPKEITYYIKDDWNRIPSNILHEVHGEKTRDGRYLFWLPKPDEKEVNVW